MIDSASRNNYYNEDCEPKADKNQEKSEPKVNFFSMSVNLTQIWLRIQEAFNSQNAAEIARKLNIERQSVYKWRDGKNAPDLERLIEISTVTGSSLHWLITGQGSREITHQPDELKEPELSKAETLLKENSLPDIFLQLLERFEKMEARLTALEPVKASDIDPLKGEPQVATEKGNPLFSIAEKTTEEQWKEICKLSGENVPIDAMVAYIEYHKRGNKRFLTHYTKHIQDLITAYKESRLEDYLSVQVPKEGKEVG